MAPRRARAAGPHLEWRIRTFFGGGILGLVGFATDRSWVVWCGLAVLGVGFLLRFIGDPGEPKDQVEASMNDDGGAATSD